jgi:cytochrome d ubiquinol oxidase subunit II
MLPAIYIAHRRRREPAAFIGSACFIAALLGVTAAAGHPYLLFSTYDPAWSITIANAAAAPATLRVGLMFWSVAIALAVVYFIYLFWSFAGKVRPDEEPGRH